MEDRFFDIKTSRVPVQDKLAELSCFQNEEGCYFVSSDISLIFNQQRLENRLSVEELREMVNRYSPASSPYFEKMDDDMLLATVKSRHIQSLSEVRAWAEQCMEEFSDALTEAQQRELEAQSSADASADASSDVSNSE